MIFHPAFNRCMTDREGHMTFDPDLTQQISASRGSVPCLHAPLLQDVIPNLEVSLGGLGRTALEELRDGLLLLLCDGPPVKLNFLFWGLQLFLLLVLLLILLIQARAALCWA